MKRLTKKYRVIYRDSVIINENYLMPQSGVTYPGNEAQSAEFDSLEEIESFIENNNLIFEAVSE